VLSGWAAGNRGDYELMQVRYATDLVYQWNPELVTLGLPSRVEGRGDWRRTVDEFNSAWEETDYALDFIIDFGERLLTLGRASFRGRASGAEVEFDYAQLIELRGGLAQHESDFTDWRQALSAAGLEPGLLDRLEALPPRGVLKLG
jgi:hypothetical protein